MSSTITALDLKENFSIPNREKVSDLEKQKLDVLNSEEVELDRIKKYLKEERGITIDPDFRYQDEDILAVFPGGTIIRKSEIIPEMQGYKFRICRYSVSCTNYERDSYYCAHNNFSRLDENGQLKCYERVQFSRKVNLERVSKQ